MFLMAEVFLICFRNPFRHIVDILLCHLVIAVPKIIPYSLQGHIVVIEQGGYCMAVIMGFENILPIADTRNLTILFHLLSECLI